MESKIDEKIGRVLRTLPISFTLLFFGLVVAF